MRENKLTTRLLPKKRSWKSSKTHRLHDFVRSSLCSKKSTSRLKIIRINIPKNLTFGFQFCIFALLNVHHFNAVRSVPTYTNYQLLTFKNLTKLWLEM